MITQTHNTTQKAKRSGWMDGWMDVQVHGAEKNRLCSCAYTVCVFYISIFIMMFFWNAYSD